jgi:hypothetical protein
LGVVLITAIPLQALPTYQEVTELDTESGFTRGTRPVGGKVQLNKKDKASISIVNQEKKPTVGFKEKK